MKSLLISIIVPVYNVEKYLSRCINSIINQTHKNLEIILVDDGSTDKSGYICEEFKAKDKRIRVIHKENGGLSDARNSGLKIAQGDYIGFVDGDDWIDVHMYEELLKVSLNNKSDIVSCGFQKIWENETVENKYILNNKKIETFNTEEALKKLLTNDSIDEMVWNKLYKYKTIKNIYFKVGKYHEDVFWTYKVIGNANCISLVNIQFYNYLQRKNSIMGQQYSKKRLDALEALEERYKYITNNFPSLKNYSITSYISSCLYHYQWISREIDVVEKSFCKNQIIERINNFKISGNEKYLDKSNKKQYMWLKLFLYFPNIVCDIRNKLKIGV